MRQGDLLPGPLTSPTRSDLMGEENAATTATSTAQRPEAEPRPARLSAAPGASPAYLWLSGELKPWADAMVHITMVGWPAIGAVFEGIRAYWNTDRQELYVVRLN